MTGRSFIASMIFGLSLSAFLVLSTAFVATWNVTLSLAALASWWATALFLEHNRAKIAALEALAELEAAERLS